MKVCILIVKEFFWAFVSLEQGILTNRILTNNEGSKARRENIFQIYCCLKKVFTFQEDKLFACLDKMLMSVVSVVKRSSINDTFIISNYMATMLSVPLITNNETCNLCFTHHKLSHKKKIFCSHIFSFHPVPSLGKRPWQTLHWQFTHWLVCVCRVFTKPRCNEKQFDNSSNDMDD